MGGLVRTHNFLAPSISGVLSISTYLEKRDLKKKEKKVRELES